ncbi:hypothetical protein [Paenibacillus sp. 8b26]|uniref:hypothetical protein n=1 Tax=Paenibacillus sp. 8b26 TaxID=3424133 RepID=UPI003D655E88
MVSLKKGYSEAKLGIPLLVYKANDQSFTAIVVSEYTVSEPSKLYFVIPKVRQFTMIENIIKALYDLEEQLRALRNTKYIIFF